MTLRLTPHISQIDEDEQFENDQTMDRQFDYEEKYGDEWDEEPVFENMHRRGGIKKNGW